MATTLARLDKERKSASSESTPPGWKLCTVSKCCRIENQLRLPINVEDRARIHGAFPYYGPTGVLDWINDYRIDGEYTLISEDGDHFLKYADFPMTIHVTGKFNVNNHAHLLVGVNGCSTRWVYYFFHHANLGPFITRQGVGRYKLTKEALKQLPVLVPPQREQESIIEILETWDRGIGAAERLLALKQQRKRALMQQLLTGKHRFPEFVKSKKSKDTPLGKIAADWPVRRIQDVFRRSTHKNGTTTALVLTASGQHGLVDQREFFDRKVAGESLEGYYLLKHGDFAYNRSAMKGYPYGAIKRLELHKCGAVSTLYHCFALSDKNCDSDFFAQLFELGLLNRQLRSICQVGGRAHGLLNVTSGDFERMVIPVPEKEEQQRIAAVLRTCDDEIDHLTTQLEALKQQKKGLMQKLLTGQVRVAGNEK